MEAATTSTMDSETNVPTTTNGEMTSAYQSNGENEMTTFQSNGVLDTDSITSDPNSNQQEYCHIFRNFDDNHHNDDTFDDAQPHNGGGGFSPPKRRKVDNEGFVTPSTPDIPQQSQYFMPSSKETLQSTSDPNSDDVTNNTDINGSQMAAAPASHILSEQGMAVKMLCSQWSDMFRDRESFEMSLPDRLDALLIAAQTLEQNLLRQKEALYKRLNFISQTLESARD